MQRVLRLRTRHFAVSLAVATTVIAGGFALQAPVAQASPKLGAAGATYVALGDSYSAGEGLGGFEKGTDVAKGSGRNQCHRSSRYAYPVLEPAVVLPRVTSRAFFACSGATSKDMQSVPPRTGPARQAHQPDQAATVGQATQYVTLSAGGNDVGFGDLGTNCVEAVISHEIKVSVSAKPCASQIADSRKKLAAAKASLINLYEALLTRAPHATVVVLGYPRVLPASYAGVPKLLGAPYCVLDHDVVPILIPGVIPLAPVVDIGLPVAQAKLLDAFTVSLNTTIQQAITAVRTARPAQQSQLRYADSYDSSVPHNCKGTTKNATVTAAELSPLGKGLSGPGLKNKIKLFLASSTLHPTKVGQKLFGHLVQTAFQTVPAPVATNFSRVDPVTPQGAISPGFTVTQRSATGSCSSGSEVGQAYRCFAANFVLDPCYALADPGTGDGTSAVCPLAPYTGALYEIGYATGLSVIQQDAFDEPIRITLTSGTSCVEAQGAHDTDSTGRVVDYYCDDQKTAVLRGLHEAGPLWSADIDHYTSDYQYTSAGTVPISSAIQIEHDVPPANRPVTDAGGATTDEFDVDGRMHHEIDCGAQATTRYASPVEQIFDNAVDCTTAQLIASEWDNGDDLETGWTCEYDSNSTVLCQDSSVIDDSAAPNFFAAAHVRFIQVG